jgi:hypothetical protein
MPREMAVKHKERVQFDFSPEALQRLDELKEKTDAATRAETVRKALKVFEWLVNEADPDGSIQILDKNKEVIANAPAKLIR